MDQRVAQGECSVRPRGDRNDQRGDEEAAEGRHGQWKQGVDVHDSGNLDRQDASSPVFAGLPVTSGQYTPVPGRTSVRLGARRREGAGLSDEELA